MLAEEADDGVVVAGGVGHQFHHVMGAVDMAERSLHGHRYATATSFFIAYCSPSSRSGSNSHVVTRAAAAE